MDVSPTTPVPDPPPAGGYPPKPNPWAAVLERVFGIDLRALACFRILLALYILLDLGCRAMDLEVFYTDYGAFPLEALFPLGARQFELGWWVYLSPYMYVSTTGAVAALFLLHAAAAVAILVGWRTRWATFLAWFMTLSLHARNPIVLHSGDVYLRMLLFWSLFLPLGARFSVDGLAAERVARNLPLPRTVLSFGTAGILIQVALMYWFTAILKVAPEWRSQFTAVYYALSIEQYATPLGQLLRPMRWFVVPATVMTMALEVVGPILAFLPVWTGRIRLVIVPIFIAFHMVLLNLTLSIGLFAYTPTIPWVLFLPSVFWDRLTEWWLRLPNFPVKRRVMEWRERAIDWRSARIARRLAAKPAAPRIGLTIAGNALACYFIWHSVSVNLYGIDAPWARKVPIPPREFTMMLRLDQYWAMFAPRPSVEDGWYVIPAQTVGGRTIDLFRDGKPMDWRKPDPLAIAALYRNDRWGKYMMNLWGQQFNAYRIYYCRYLERQCQKRYHGSDAVVSFQIIFMLKETQPDYRPYKVVPVTTYAYRCTGVPETGGALTNVNR